MVLGLIGIVLTVGGAWLVALGGSPYYVIAGVAMLASAWFLFRGRLLGGWIYLGLFILSAIWGFAEARGNAWAMVPWLIAPLVLLVAVLLVMPTLTRADSRWRLAGGGIALALVFVIASFAVTRQQSAASACAALPAQCFAGHAGPVAVADRRRLAVLWRDQRGMALLAADADRSDQRRQASGRCGKCTPTGCPTDPDYAKLYGTENTPLKVGNLLYTCTAKNMIIALDAATGKPVWRVDPKVPDTWIPYTTACRGVAYYAVPGAAPNTACAARIIEGTMDSRLIEVDALTGKPCTEFNGTRRAGHQDRHGLDSAGLGRDQLRADRRARDHRRRAPDPRRPVPLRALGRHPGFRRQDRQARLGMGHAASRLDRLSAHGPDLDAGTPNSWTTSRPTRNWAWSSSRPAMSPTIISRAAGPRRRMPIRARSSRSTRPRGGRAGCFQTVKKDVWDYDIGSQPSLIDYKGTPALLVSSKQGDLYVLDRATGKPLTPVATIRAPQGGLEPKLHSPTQIVSAWNSCGSPTCSNPTCGGCRRSTR